MHRDSLRYELPIRAGAVNLMNAGRGKVHSARAGSDLDAVSKLHGILSWMALPVEFREIGPAFAHIPAADRPEIQQNGAAIRVIIANAYGQTSPVRAYSSKLYLDCDMQQGAELELPDGFEQLAFYVASGAVSSAGHTAPEGVMLVAARGARLRLKATRHSRFMVVGGENLGDRHIWWNFGSSNRGRIEEAKQEWAAGGFTRVDGDDEYIPLPDLA